MVFMSCMFWKMCCDSLCLRLNVMLLIGLLLRLGIYCKLVRLILFFWKFIMLVCVVIWSSGCCLGSVSRISMINVS